MTGSSSSRPSERAGQLARRVWHSPALPSVVRERLRPMLRSRTAVRPAEPDLGVFRLPTETFVRYAFNVMLRREPDPQGLAHYTGMLARRELSRGDVLDHIRAAEEFRWGVNYVDLLASLHYSRCEFVRSLPRASRILDLGGTHQSDRRGAMVAALHYPYPFEELVVIDLPHEDRHRIYRQSERSDRVETDKGAVTYRYQSMADLTGLDDGSFDLVYSGQTIEHVTPADADRTLREVWRVLRPGGYLALDTPNGPVCRLHMPQFINDDHKIEYAEAEFTAMLRAAGYDILEVKGLNYLGHPWEEGGRFDLPEVAANWGLFAAAGDCYLLAYLCQKPPT